MRTIRDCNVAVVGGAGFLGSHLVNYLIDNRNCNVLVVDNLCAGRREFVHSKARFVHHDITGSEARLLRIFRDFSFGPCKWYVFNYAAYPYIPDSFARPIHVCDVNFMGAMKVINAAQEAGAEAILQVSSAEIYGHAIQFNNDRSKPEWSEANTSGAISEIAPVIPHSSYGVAKAAVDSWVQCRWREAKTPCIALRQFNCVGERETHPYIVPEIISQVQRHVAAYWSKIGAWSSDKEPELKRQMAKLTPTVHLGNNSFRDFMYVGDAVRIAVELLERGQFGEVYNLGSETGVKMYNLAKLIGKVMGFADVEIVPDPTRVRPWEIWFLLSSNDKLRSVVGDYTCISLEESLQKTVTWYNKNGRKWPWEV